MASVIGGGKHRILVDEDGDAVTVSSNRLDVNAHLTSGATIDIGDVDMFLDGGTAIVGGAGAVSAGVLRVTLASDDTHFGAVGAAADDDGTIHGQLRAISNGTGQTKAAIDTSNSHLGTIKLIVKSAGGAFTAWDVGAPSLVVRNDTLANLDGNIADGDYSMLQVNSSGALYVDIADGGQLDTLLDTLETTLTAIETDQAAIEVLLTGIDSDTDAIKTAVQTLDNAISGSEMQVNVVASLPAGSAAIGKLAANSGVDIGDVDVTSLPSDTFVAEDGALGKGVLLQGDDGSDRKNVLVDSSGRLKVDIATSSSGTSVPVGITAGSAIIGKVGHDITGGADGVKIVSSAGTDVVLGGDVDCKKIDIQAQTDNTGLIAVGFTGVDATEATGTGIILYAGDTYSLEMVNLNLIYIDSTVSGEGVRYTYFT